MLYYEIHVTVKVNDVEQFRAECEKLKVKPIILDLQQRSGNVFAEVMTSSTVETLDVTIQTAAAEVERISAAMQHAGFNVERCKIETVPWHPDVPTAFNAKDHFPGSHFETHFGIVVSEGEQETALREVANTFDLHLSKNVFKRLPNNRYVQMATYRSYTDLKEQFEEKVHQITDALSVSRLPLEKDPKIEFSIFDSDYTYDQQWLS